MVYKQGSMNHLALPKVYIFKSRSYKILKKTWPKSACETNNFTCPRPFSNGKCQILRELGQHNVIDTTDVLLPDGTKPLTEPKMTYHQ